MVERVLVGVVAGAHGIRGQVRIKTFTADPASIAAYGPVTDDPGSRQFELTVTGTFKGGVIVRIAGVNDRNAAEALRGLNLYLPRTALPEPGNGEFYYADLFGLTVERVDGSPYGSVVGIGNYGAGDILEIERPDGQTEFLPFTTEVVPVVDVPGGRLVISPPAEVEVRPGGTNEDGGVEA